MPTSTPPRKIESQQPWPNPNPALSGLAILLGNWDVLLTDTLFLPNPSDTLKGYASFAWISDGAFLEMRQGAQPPVPDGSVWLIGRDESSGAYQALYYDSRGVSRNYQMSFENGVWKMWRDWPAFRQRFEATLTKDGNTIKAYWEKSVDGKPWERDFNMTFTRVS
jgi:hypothetical protein